MTTLSRKRSTLPAQSHARIPHDSISLSTAYLRHHMHTGARAHTHKTRPTRTHTALYEEEPEEEDNADNYFGPHNT